MIIALELESHQPTACELDSKESQKLPEISHLQFAIIDSCLGHEWKRGRDIRKALKCLGWERSLPSFYKQMNRLLQSGLVVSDSQQQRFDKHVETHTLYRLTETGERVHTSTLNYYVTRSAVRKLLAGKQTKGQVR